MRRLVILSTLTTIALGACAAPADVAGDYSVSVTNGANECDFVGWTEGNSETGIPVTVTQADDQVQLDVGGASGLALDFVVGSSLFSGQVSGDRARAALIGDNAGSQGECTYTVTVDLDARVDGDVIQGTLEWRPVTNGHPDCGALETCTNTQDFNGTRPPGS